MQNDALSEKLFLLFQHSFHLIGRGRHPGGGDHGSHSGHGQGRVLSVLNDRPGISQKELLEILQVRAGSLSELLSKLESAGHITREKNGDDNRIVNVFITETGQSFVADSKRHLKEVSVARFAPLSAQEKAELAHLLEKLIASWQTENNFDPKEDPTHAEHL